MADRDPSDSLRSALDRLQIGGALFLHARYTENWAFRPVPMKDLGRILAPDADRVLPFHVVVSGRIWFDIGEGKHWAEAGDVVFFPYGHPHMMGGEGEADVVEAATLVAAPPWDRMPFIDHGGGGSETRLVCGYLTTDEPLFNPELRAFPSIVVVTLDDAAAPWVRASAEFALQQTHLVDTDRAETPPGLVRLLFIEVLKQHLATAPAAEQGFIRALHDPVVAPALARIHEQPGTKWTVCDLAEAAHVSESLLDSRFRQILGMPPIRYLATWRMHVAQDLLRTTALSVLAVSRRVGYDSEEAFSRAFKRKFEIPPSVWRSRV